MADTLPLEGEKIKHYSIIFTPPPFFAAAVPYHYSIQKRGSHFALLRYFADFVVVAIPQLHYFPI